MTKKITLLILSFVLFAHCFAQKSKVKKSKAQHIEFNSDVHPNRLYSFFHLFHEKIIF